MKNLVIVESPAKAKTIEKFLGKDYKVMSSFGHIRDLCKKGISVDVDTDFSPVYEISPDKKDLVRQLKSEANKADMVWLASDEDREGEAIAWHLYEVLELKPEKTRRIVFHEITKPAILHAIAHPRGIDLARVNAQQARRVLDRIVGFELSPVLWRKIKPALSAGRVQSVAVRLICEREKEIQAFLPETFFRVNALFHTADGEPVKTELTKRLKTEEATMNLLTHCSAIIEDPKKEGGFTVKDVSVKPLKRSPQPPFTTSTLQQEASRRLGFSVNNTMRIAQQLYEAGAITYMRTDSTNLSELALNDISRLIKEKYGEEYHHRHHYHTTSKGAQEAHEAIRPTYIDNVTVDGTDQEKRLYDLIRRRAIASQMEDCRLEKTIADVEVPGTDDIFRAEGEVVKFEGYLKAYSDESATAGVKLPPLTAGEKLICEEVKATERHTQAPARYTEGNLIRKMEELGIGRPATYAPTISTILQRDYIRVGEKEGVARNFDVLTVTAGGEITRSVMTEKTGSDKKRLVPTDVGMVVNEFLTEYFPDILDYNFTARVEQKFDEIAEGKLEWKDEIAGFYEQFHPNIEEINSLRLEHKVGERVLGKDPVSGKPVSVKIGRFGPVVQIGDANDEEKPQFASLQKDQSVASLTLEEALKLFELPRTLGEYDGKVVKAAVGRFGPYVQGGGVFVSIPKDMSPMTITYEQAVELIEKKIENDANKLIKKFDELPGVEILNGRFGPYIAYKPEGVRKAVNFKIPKTTDPASLTVDEVKKLMEEKPKKKTTRSKSR